MRPGAPQPLHLVLVLVLLLVAEELKGRMRSGEEQAAEDGAPGEVEVQEEIAKIIITTASPAFGGGGSTKNPFKDKPRREGQPGALKKHLKPRAQRS